MNYARSMFIYTTSEIISYKTKDKDSSLEPKASLNRILFGSFVDVVVMRNFHRFVDSKSLSTIQKTVLEQIAIAPSIGLSFLILHNNFSTSNWVSIYMDDCKFWPIASFIGYSFVSTERRYLYSGCCSVIWNNYRILMYTV